MNDMPTPATVRRRLTEIFKSLAIFKRDRGAALYHFCVALELIPTPLSDNPDLAMAKGRHATEASIRAVPAIFQLCPAASSTPSIEINSAILAEAKELVGFASRFDQVMYCFELADREQHAVRYDPLTQRTIFTYTSPDESAADTLLRTHERDTRIHAASAADIAISLKQTQIIKEQLQGSLLYVSPDAIEYSWTPVLRNVARERAEFILNAMPWDFPENLVVGNMTFRDIRKFWGALLTLAFIHDGAHIMASQGDNAKTPRGSILLVKRREEWAELIADIGSIGIGAVSELLWWYTCDPKVAETAGPIQPFFEVSLGLLALPMTLVTTHSVERNLQKILNQHPNLRSFYPRLKDAKEDIALSYLRTLFPETAFVAKPTIIIEGVTDADLVIYERASGFVLVIQHKWLIAPESVRESGANDDELRKGASQATRSRDAFRKDPTLLRRELGLSQEQPISGVEAVVICRGAEPTAFLGKLGIPIALERAFEDLWQESGRSMKELWEKLSSRPDHKKAAERYKDTPFTITVGGMDFTFPGFSLGISL